MYWDVIEILREEEKFSYPSDENSLQMLCDLIGYKDVNRFINWLKDAKKHELFIEKNGVFFSPSLCKRMKVFQSKVQNGSKLKSVANLERNESEIEANVERNVSNRIDKNRIEYNKEYIQFLDTFNSIMKKKFRGTSKDKTQFNARMKEGFSLQDFENAIKNCSNDSYHKQNPQYLTPEFITRSDKLQKYLNLTVQHEPIINGIPKGRNYNSEWVDGR